MKKFVVKFQIGDFVKGTKEFTEEAELNKFVKQLLKQKFALASVKPNKRLTRDEKKRIQNYPLSVSITHEL